MLLKIEDLTTQVGDKTVLDGLSLAIPRGSIHALMGPNGSGKSSLAMALLGHPAHTITAGTAIFDGKDLLALATHERAKAGLFLAFQNPVEIDGVPLRDLIRQSFNALYHGTDRQLNFAEFQELLQDKAKLLNLPPAFLDRSLNVGCSGGEKKLAETLQLLVLEPKLAILDELDAGLDIDALAAVTSAIKTLIPSTTFLIITHHPRFLKHLTPDSVHIIKNGTVTQSDGPELLHQISASGYRNNS